MTFEQKVALALGDFDAVADLGVPALRYTDGPNGIRGPENVTAFPASLALAATFDEGLAAAYGAAVAEEARDTGSNVLLGPAVDIARVPLGGRLPEAMGEDPYLTSRSPLPRSGPSKPARRLDGQALRRQQRGDPAHRLCDQQRPQARLSTRWSATALSRRFIYPRPQGGGPAWPSRVGDGLLQPAQRELCLPAPGHLGSLKQDWGWDGFVAPDFLHAVRDPVAAANAGLDIPGLGVTEGRTAEDFTSGRIPAERLDEIVRRTLFAIFDAGLDEHPLRDDARLPALASTPEHVALAPGSPPTGWSCSPTVTVCCRLMPGRSAGGGRHRPLRRPVGDGGVACVWVSPDRRVTPLEGITARAGRSVRVAFAQGSLGDAALPGVPAEALKPAGSEGMGLLGEYWNGETPDGEPALTVVDPGWTSPRPPRGCGARLVRPLDRDDHPDRDGPHRFTVLAAGISRLESTGCGSPPVNGSRPGVRRTSNAGERLVDLRAGQPVAIRVEYSGAMA